MLHTEYSILFSYKELLIFWLFIKFVPKDPIENIPTLVQINGLGPTRPQAILWTYDG